MVDFLRQLFSDKETLILAALEERPKYGLELCDETGLSFGFLYPVLHRLERAGKIESYWDEQRRPERGGARRKYYKLR